MSHPDYEHIGDPAVKVVEECAELIKAICKAQRFGWKNHHPLYPALTNQKAAEDEMADVQRAIAALKTHIARGEKETLA